MADVVETRWQKAVSANTPVVLNTRELNSILTSIFQLQSAVFDLSGAIFRSSPQPEAFERAKEAHRMASLSLENTQAALAALEARIEVE